jgi:membrane protein DedA with SNARE-associated domain
MMFGQFSQEAVEFVRAHETWELPVVATLAFGESLAVIGLFVPATVALVGIGALVGASGIDFVPVWAAVAIGAAAGDWGCPTGLASASRRLLRACGRSLAIPI